MRIEDLAFGPPHWFELATTTNAVLTVQHAANPGNAHYIDEVHLSVSKATTTAVDLTLYSGTTPRRVWQIPVGFLGPLVILLPRPIHLVEGELAELTVGAMGAGVVATVILAGKTGR